MVFTHTHTDTHTDTHNTLWEEREDRIRDRRWRVSFASARSRRGLPTGSSSAGCGVWCVVVVVLLLLRLHEFLFLVFGRIIVVIFSFSCGGVFVGMERVVASR